MNGSRSLGIGPVGAFMPGEDVMEPAPLVSREMLQAFGPSLLSRMREADAAQQQRWQAGERSPTPMTEENAWLADDVAGSLLGPMGLAGITKGFRQDVADKAFEHFGRTFNPREAGYILPDGRMLDLSGRHYTGGFERQSVGTWKPSAGEADWLRDQRNVDHREVFDVVGEGGSEAAMRQFMDQAGAVRAHPNSQGVGFDTAGMPEPKQIEEMVKAHRRVSPREPMTIDVHDESGALLSSTVIESPTIDKLTAYFRGVYR